MWIVHVGLGSNLGEPEANLRRALELLAELESVEVEKTSSTYRTEPQGVKDQPWFANQVVRLRVAEEWTPEGFLAALHAIEAKLGRNRAAELRWGPRIIDLDLLDFDGREMASEDLTLPHPRIAERAFVLVPLVEISPELQVHGGKTSAHALKKLVHNLKGVEILQD